MLKEAIYKRAAIRKYKDELLSEDILNLIRNIIDEQNPLIDGLRYQIDLVKSSKEFQKVLGGIVGSYGKVVAPYYLIASAENKLFAYENIGYMLEYIVLRLTDMNIGTCWIGGGIRKDLFIKFLHLEENLNPIVVIAFGIPQMDEFRTSLDEFKRKDLDKISIGPFSNVYTEVMEKVRLAPSAVNLQPWRYYFEEQDLVDLYRVKNNFLLKSHFEDMNRLDLGISISHFDIGIKDLNKSIALIDLHKTKDKLIYLASFKIK